MCISSVECTINSRRDTSELMVKKNDRLDVKIASDKEDSDIRNRRDTTELVLKNNDSLGIRITDHEEDRDIIRKAVASNGKIITAELWNEKTKTVLQ